MTEQAEIIAAFVASLALLTYFTGDERAKEMVRDCAIWAIVAGIVIFPLLWLAR